MASLLSLKALILTALSCPLLSHAAAPYCLSGQSCFPSEDVLQQFNASIDGRLIKGEPYGAACYKATYNADECKQLATSKADVFYRQSLPVGTMYTNWEQDGDKGCPVPDLPKDDSAPAAVDAECTLGGMSAYAVNATTADHIAAAVKFAAQYNLRYRVKNSGHDYTGRSSGVGAFSVWTRHMNEAVMQKNFTPCSGDNAQDVLSAGPGVDVEELFNFGGANGVTTIGGFTTTVGATGGYILGGGTGPLGPLYGMGVDNIVQLEVVTADGSKKTLNRCTNTDLFWAMRGGGGTFATTTRVYLKTWPAFKAVNTVAGAIGCSNYSAYSELISQLVDIQVDVRNNNHSGIWESSGAQLGLELLSIVPFQDGVAVRSANDTLNDYQKVISVAGCQSGLKGAQFTGSDSWNQAYQGVIWPTVRTGSGVGVNLADFSRLISYDAINNQDKRNAMKKYVLELPADVPFIWQNTVGEASKKVATDATAVHPDWRDAFAFMDVPVFGPWSGVTAAQNATAQAVLDNATSIFGTTTYYNEDYVLEKNWQESMFGSNYAKLLSIKKQYDPKGLFNFRQGVGSEDGF